MALLCVDASYDRTLRSFAASRRSYLAERFGPQPNDEWLQLGESRAHRETVLEYCALRDGDSLRYDLMSFCSHGSAGTVKQRRYGIETDMFSTEDDEEVLRALANGRRIFLLCCKTARDEFPEKLLSCGARQVIGFGESPRWRDGYPAEDFWKHVDRSLIDCLIEGNLVGQIEMKKDELIQEAEELRDGPGSGPALANDYQKAIDVLNTLIVVGDDTAVEMM